MLDHKSWVYCFCLLLLLLLLLLLFIRLLLLLLRIIPCMASLSAAGKEKKRIKSIKRRWNEANFCCVKCQGMRVKETFKQRNCICFLYHTDLLTFYSIVLEFIAGCKLSKETKSSTISILLIIFVTKALWKLRKRSRWRQRNP